MSNYSTMYFDWIEQHTWRLIKEMLIVKAPTRHLVYRGFKEQLCQITW